VPDTAVPNGTLFTTLLASWEIAVVTSLVPDWAATASTKAKTWPALELLVVLKLTWLISAFELVPRIFCAVARFCALTTLLVTVVPLAWRESTAWAAMLVAKLT